MKEDIYNERFLRLFDNAHFLNRLRLTRFSSDLTWNTAGPHSCPELRIVKIRVGRLAAYRRPGGSPDGRLTGCCWGPCSAATTLLHSEGMNAGGR